MILFLASLIGFVEYQLPEVGHAWKEVSQVATEGPVVNLYQPEPQKDTKEFFGATYNKERGKNHSQNTLTELLKKQFPQDDVKVIVLENDLNSILYEWIVGKNERIHGFTRIFNTDQGNVALAYFTHKPQNVSQVREKILKSLKNAKII